MPYVAPPFPPYTPFVAPPNLSWALDYQSCVPSNLECRARAIATIATIAKLAADEKAKYDADKIAYELKWSGNRTAQGMPIAAGYENQYDSRGIYIGPSSSAVSAAKANLTSLVQSAGSASGGLFDVVSCEVDAKPPICRVYLAAFSSVYSKNRNAIGAAAARLAGIAATSPPQPAGAQPSQPLAQPSQPLTAVSAVASVAAIINSRPPTTLKKPKGHAITKPKRVSSASSN